MDLANKVALITGAKQIGADVARELARRGADVVVTYARSKAEADAVVGDIKAIGRRGLALQANLTDPAQCELVVTQTVDAFGRLDVLVAMASVYKKLRRSISWSLAAWNKTVDVDLRSTFLCAIAAVPHDAEAG